MTNRRHGPLFLVLATAVLFLALEGRAEADSILQVRGFSASGLPYFDQIVFDPFDPALGTLDEVRVHISGSLTYQVATQPQGAPAPTSYAFLANAIQDFTGLAGRGFSFDPSATLQYNGTASGSGEVLPLTTAYEYHFTFDATTDLLGFVFPTASATPAILFPPAQISGLRSDFEKLFPGDPGIMIDVLVTAGPSDPRVTASSFDGGGVMTIEYVFTPAVPEPGALALMTLAAAGVAWRRRRRAPSADEKTGRPQPPGSSRFRVDG